LLSEGGIHPDKRMFEISNSGQRDLYPFQYPQVQYEVRFFVAVDCGDSEYDLENCGINISRKYMASVKPTLTQRTKADLATELGVPDYHLGDEFPSINCRFVGISKGCDDDKVDIVVPLGQEVLDQSPSRAVTGEMRICPQSSLPRPSSQSTESSHARL